MKYKRYDYIIDCRKATPEQLDFLEQVCEYMKLDSRVEHD
jgi:hypothetical protein